MIRPKMIVCHFLIMALAITPACTAKDSSQSPTGLLTGNSDITAEPIPEFILRGDSCDVYFRERLLFSYDESQITDLDDPKSPTFKNNEDKRRTFLLINGAIRGAYESGDFTLYSNYLFNIDKKLARQASIGKPLLIKNMEDRSTDFYLVPLIYDNKLVAASLLEVTPDCQSINLVSETKARQPLSELPTISEIPGLSINTLERAISPETQFAVQEIKRAGFERVFFRSNHPDNTTLGFYFLVEQGPSKRYCISGLGKSYEISNNSVQTLSNQTHAGIIYLKPL